MPDRSAAAVVVAPEALTLTWIAVGGIIVELLVLLIFLVRVSWWLSQRFTAIDANFNAIGTDVARLKADVGNDIAGRKVVAAARTDIAEMRTGLNDIRDRLARLEEHEDRRRPPAAG